MESWGCAALTLHSNKRKTKYWLLHLRRGHWPGICLLRAGAFVKATLWQSTSRRPNHMTRVDWPLSGAENPSHIVKPLYCIVRYSQTELTSTGKLFNSVSFPLFPGFLCDVLNSHKYLIWMPAPLKRKTISPGWCGSVDWVLACKPKGRQFNAQSGHMPGLQARSPVKGRARGNHTMTFLSLSFHFPSPLSKNK